MRGLLTAVLAAGLLAAPATAAASPAPVPAYAAPTATYAGGPGAPATVRCEFTPTPENPAARPVGLPSKRAAAKGTADVLFVTNYGPFVVRLGKANAPCGVHSFIHLVNSRFYNHSQCFRLTDSARLGVLQCGDVYRQEEGGPGYRFADEVTGRETYPRGTVAMGNQGPGTNGSEFFVVHSFANIPPDYTVLGHVTYGMATFDRMVRAGIADPDRDGPPRFPVWILLAVQLR